MPTPTKVLVVDDSPTQLKQMQWLLEEEGYCVVAAADGAEAMEILRNDPPDLVVTDLQMPRMNGLELVVAAKQAIPGLPVILTTAVGSEAVAAEALRKGASSYVPKRLLFETLRPTVRQVLAVARAAQSKHQVAVFVAKAQLDFELANDCSLIPGVIARLESSFAELGLYDEMTQMQVAMALDEAILNAMVHGNLEISSEMRDAEASSYCELLEKRPCQSPFCDRRVEISFEATRDEASFSIRDQGPGFDRSKISDPTDPENLDKVGGRGLLLIHTFMDEVRHNEKGNQIIMRKRKSNGSAG